MTDAEKLTNEITNYVNSFTLKSEEFTEAMSREHRTLQQSFTRLCLKWIEHCASDEYRHDLRNEASHDICKTIIESFTNSNPSKSLPFDTTNIAPSNFLPSI